MKKCCTCKKEKELSEFGKHRQWLDGYRPQCKECRNSRLRTGKKPGPPLGNIPWNKGKKGIVKAWNKGVQFEKNGTARSCRRYQNWRKKVLERDEYKCKKCGETKRLIVHHIIPYFQEYDKRVDVDNGLTLCVVCHGKIENLGKRRSPKTEIKKGQRISKDTEFKKDMIPWNKGKVWSKEMRNKLSISHKGQHSSPATEFKKGMIPWNKGKSPSKE